nr:HAMP domain-containing sensor histidine kinase [Lacrimispora amygdalina]
MTLTYILGLLLCVSLFLGGISFAKLISIRKQIQEMSETLSDIGSGNGNRKILAASNELTAELSYKLNEIVYSYEEQIYKFRTADEANRQLMTSLSHDVRTPLTTLIGYLDAIHRGVASPEDYENYIETARLKAHDLKNYIDVLFDWFKLNSSEFTLYPQQIELAELTRNILKNWVPIFEEKRIHFEIEIPEKPFLTNVDPDCYERIINNLVQNVISHSQASIITIQMEKEETNIVVRIKDNGIGINEADLQHIFERLYKCDKGRSDKGSGLGLSIVRQLVEKMNGMIEAESEPNHYTIFIVRFPAAN